MASDLVSDYTWIVAFGLIIAFFAAFGIGANDVANAYATSVGSKALTIKQACVLAVIFEFAGAVAAGSTVSDTIRKKIADVDCFEEDEAMLMYGNFIVLCSVAVWLIVATWAEMPVSTTHSCVGGLIGMTIVAKGSGCVNWSSKGDEDTLWLPEGVLAIVLSWIISPLLSGCFAVLIYGITRKFVLRASDSFGRAIKFYPVLVFSAVFLNVFFVLSKGISKKICPKKGDHIGFMCRTDDDGGPKGKVNPASALWVSCICGIVAAALLYPMYKWIEEQGNQRGEEWGTSSANKEKATGTASVDAVVVEDKPKTRYQKFVKALFFNVNQDIHEAVQDEKIGAIHENAEKFENKAEFVFTYIQIFTAICDSFAHGANDVANAMGPFMAIYGIWQTGKVGSKSGNDESDGYWILAIGGVGIGIGLLLYGYKIMRAIGVKLSKITPSRGFSIELGAAVVIILGSYLGLPLSTTHCQVGATTGVALLEGGKGVNWFLLGKIVVGWVITLAVVGFSTGTLLAQGIRAPVAGQLKQGYLDRFCPRECASHNCFSFNSTVCDPWRTWDGCLGGLCD